MFSPNEYYARLHRAMSLLDDETIKILETMKKFGPRNLRQVATESGVSYSTVYGRVGKLEADSVLCTWIHPNYSKIGLRRAMVLTRTFPGKEQLAREALKIPGYWLRLFRCAGESNEYYSLHGIPISSQNDFQQYLSQLVARGIVRDNRIVWLGESFSPLPNFDYYNRKERSWRFEWREWSDQLKSPKFIERKPHPSSDDRFDKKDLIILKEMVKDARITIADLSKLLDMTLPAAKYRFDRLVEQGFISDFVVSVLPFIPEISDLCEVQLDFTTETSLKAAVEVLSKTPFSVTITPIEGLNSLTLRTYLPRSQMGSFVNTLEFLSGEGVIGAYSYVTLDWSTQETQTFAFKYFSDNSGWRYDNKEYLTKLTELHARHSKHPLDPLTARTEASLSIQ